VTGGWSKGGVALSLLASGLLAGCNGQRGQMAGDSGKPAGVGGGKDPAFQRVAVPAPLNELLPKAIRIHEFTAAAELPKGKQGIDMWIQVNDGFDSRNKAFGQFRFELRRLVPAEPEPAGELIRWWQIDLSDVARNKQHWQNTHMLYLFRLECDQPLVMGSRYVLVAVFDSPFTERLFTRRVFVARP